VSRLRAFGRFWWAFVIGDDWRLALGGGIALGATAALVSMGVSAWWLTPILVIAVLIGALVRARPIEADSVHSKGG
jgi:hypothetical protein